MRISIIAAIDNQNALGYKGHLLFHLPNDLKRFKQLTIGHTVIMGRKTYLSLPKGALPNRRNIVLSRHSGLTYPNVEIFSSLREALLGCNQDECVYIIGGAEVYAQAMPLADELCLTLVHDTAREADVFFPTIQNDEWVETFRETHPKDERHLYTYDFITYKRK